ESWALERSLRSSPESLDWATPPSGCITPSCLHNLLTDGFYAPFASNPRYLLLIDCRPEKSFCRSRLVTARSVSALQEGPAPEKCYSVVLYDDVPRTAPPSPLEEGPLSTLYHDFKRQRLDPLIVVGGWATIEIICSHLVVEGGPALLPKALPWYPSLMIPGFLYLGQADMASDRRILTQLRVTHIVALSDIVPRRVLPSTNYLVVPLPEGDPASEADLSQGPDLVSSMPTILAFFSEAKSFGGSVLVYCDQGFTRAAAVVMALLMAERGCSLEDAFYYVRRARSSVHPHRHLLQQLLSYEISLFGAPLTAIDELF
ncbi:UNVERIFIED_CONTAM: hypothetical protein GTU68_041534, partial [Idotea baltica]|nr:hypothetical protein [Idotea baltica]